MPVLPAFFKVWAKGPGIPSPVSQIFLSLVIGIFAGPTNQSIPAQNGFVEPIPQAPLLSVGIRSCFPIFYYLLPWSFDYHYGYGVLPFSFLILGDLGASLSALPYSFPLLFLTRSRTSFKVLAPTFRMLLLISRFQRVSTSASANKACMSPLLRVPILEKARASNLTTLSPNSSNPSLSSYHSFRTAFIAVHSLVYCWTRASFSSSQVIPGFS